MLIKRVITAIVVLPGIIFLIFQKDKLGFSIAVAVAALIALYEYLEIVTLICSGVISKKIKALSYLTCIGIVIGAYFQSMSGIIVFLGFNILFSCQRLVIPHDAERIFRLYSSDSVFVLTS